MEVLLNELFYDGEKPPKLSHLAMRKTADDVAWGSSGKDGKMLSQFRRVFSRIKPDDLKLLLFMAQKMAQPTHAKA